MVRSGQVAHLFPFMNIQGDTLQSQLKAFAVLQAVVLELQSASLGPLQRQTAALDSPTGLKRTITEGER